MSFMPLYTHRIRCGAATVSIFNACDLKFDLSFAMKCDAATVDPNFTDAFAETLRLPVQCVLIQLPETTLLVDAGRYEFGADSPFALPNYTPPPPLPEQLHASGIDPASIEHIIITHAHSDHFNALTELQQGEDTASQTMLSFPNATIYLARADWERQEVQRDLTDPASTISRTLGYAQAAGRLQLVDGDRELGQGISIIATPGETAGHQIVRVESAGQVLYCLGDLYHHEYEVAHPDESAFWVDAALNHRSRTRWMAQTQSEDAQLIATHIRGVGHLTISDAGPQWVAL